MHSVNSEVTAPHLPWCVTENPTNLPDIYDAVPVGLCIVGPDLRFRSINRRMAEMTGRPAEENVGRTLSEVTPGVATQLTPELQRVLRGERVLDLELRGTLMSTPCAGRVFLVSLEPLRGADGGVNAVLCSALDITERKLAEEALRDHRVRLTNLIEQAAVGIAQTDLEGRLVLVNERFAEISGRDRNALLGCFMLDITHPEDVRENQKLFARLVQTGEPFSLEKRYTRPDGSIVWVSNYVSTTRDDAGRPQFVLAIVQDITARKDAEAKLRASEEIRRLASATGKVGVFRSDFRTHLTTCCPTAQAMFGLQDGRESLPTEVWTKAILPEDRQRILEELGRSFAAKQHEATFSYRIRRLDDGGLRHIEGRSRLEYDLDGPPLAALGVVIDVTERATFEAALRESEDHHRHTVELSPLVSWTADPAGKILDISSGWEALTGMPVAEGLQHWQDAIYPEDLPMVDEAWNGALRTGASFDIEYRLRSAGGGHLWVRARAAPRRDTDGTIMRWYGTIADVNKRKLADLALRQSEAFTRSVVESTTECIKVLDLDGRLLFMNSPGLRLNELRDFASIAGRYWAALLPEPMATEAGQAIAAAREGRSVQFTAENHVAGVPKWWDVIVSPIMDDTGAVTRILVISRDITEKRSAQEQITRLVYQDALTNLANRRLMRQELALSLTRTSMGERIALHYIDLDHFKVVNDTMGHLVGDALLQQAAERLRRCVRRSDVVARLGGDEFAILQAGVHAAEDAATLASHVIAAFASPFQLEGRQVTTGVSIGIALAPGHANTPDDLVRDADIALYRAKADGRNTFRFFEPTMADEIRRKEELKAGLGTALEQDGFALYFQPLVCLRSGRVTGFEALARLRHPAQGLISPAEFIPVAEESGFIGRLGSWALLASCCEAARWPGPARVAVNLSPTQFRDPSLLEYVKQALATSGLTPERLELEITESVLMQNSEANVAILQELRGLGVRIAIDDFGTGFSSLGYLLRFPFDKIKIDRSFVAELPGSVQSKAIIRAIASIGRGLGISITAEGVETAEQLAMVRRQGCAEAQGYVFSRPVPGTEVASLLGRQFQVIAGADSDPGRRSKAPRAQTHR